MEEEPREVMKSFKELGLCEPLVEVCDKLGWKAHTKIEVEAIPHALEGKDIIGVVQSGSGKTGAFALPIIQAFLDSESPQPFFACVISPTWELAVQIAEQFNALGAGIGLRTTVLLGGIDMKKQQIALAKRPHIIVGTPRRLMDHLSTTEGFSLRALKYLVLDEADRLLNEGFEKELDDILRVMPHERRTYLFSATMTEKVEKLQRACLRNPVKIEVAFVDTLKEQYVILPAEHKECYLVYILMEMSKSRTMVFTRTCDATRLLALLLRNLGLRAIPISGQMTQNKRYGALNQFKAGECNILIATDVASRGLDIPSVDMVINYDIPSNSKNRRGATSAYVWQTKTIEALKKFIAGEFNILICTDVVTRGLDIAVDLVINYDIPSNSMDYIYGVGRTARARRSCFIISLVNQDEFERFIQITKQIGEKLPKFPVKEEEVLLLLERVTEAKRISQRKINKYGRKKRKSGLQKQTRFSAVSLIATVLLMWILFYFFVKQ